MSTNGERLRVIQRVTAAWEAEVAGTVAPDAAYAKDGRSQYPEGINVLSASVEQQDELQRRIELALTNAGLPVEYDPTAT